MRFGFFITPHGFGHAARAAALMESLRKSKPDCEFEIVTTVPRAFFEQSIGPHFEYHSIRSDVGFIQKSPLVVELDATIAALKNFYPPRVGFLEQVIAQFGGRQLDAILCDIAPVGIAVAEKMGIPSVLIENFTWDWIYSGYLEREPRFAEVIETLKKLSSSATFHFQATPIGVPSASATHFPVMVRGLREAPASVRAKLQIPKSDRVVLISLGGIPADLRFLEQLQHVTGITFLVGAAGAPIRKEKNVIFFAPQSGLFHPDLVAASDLVIGKLGYSTVAEVLAAQTRFLFIDRPEFREAAALKALVIERGGSHEISEQQFDSGNWIAELPKFFALSQPQAVPTNGAALAAKTLLNVLGK